MGFGGTAGGAAAVMVWLDIEGKKHKVELPAWAASGAVEAVVDGRRTLVNVQVLEAGVITYTSSPWSAKSRFVLKSSGDLRPVHQYVISSVP